LPAIDLKAKDLFGISPQKESDMTGQLVTIFGGSGFVGRHLVQRLAREGWRIRVAVRRPNEVPEIKTGGDVGQIQIFQANVRHEGSVLEAVEGADVVINLVGLLVQGGKQKFKAVHVDGADTVARAARAAGAKQLIHMSALSADLNAESLYARTKADGELAARAAFPTATIFRPSVIFGPDDGFFNRLASLVRMTQIVPLIGFGKTRFQPIYIGDLVDAFVAVIGDPDKHGKIYELGGPDVMNLSEVLRTLASEMGRPRIFVPWPFWATRINAFFLQMPHTFLRIPPLLTVDQVRLLQSDAVVSGSEGLGTLADLGVENLTPTSAVVSGYMTRFRKHGQYNPRPVQKA
jgi:uncharacterized protein YbjT (DUF2867 family)